MKKVLAAVALLGVVGVAQAAPATLVSVTSYSKSGTSNWALNSAGTWDLGTGTGVATQTGGTLNMTTKVGATPLMTQTMTGGVLSSGAASATTWACIEGAFGGIVGAHICGNYSFGANGINDSIYTPTATGATVTIGGDDVAIGAPQTLANSYSGMTLAYLGPGSFGGADWGLSNGVFGVGGYDFCFGTADFSCFSTVPIPAAAWLFGSALGLMGGTDYLAYYDDVLDVTWAADANLAQTLGYDDDGRMTVPQAQTWIASLNAMNDGEGFLRVDNWRLPRLINDIDSEDDDLLGNDGCQMTNRFNGTDCGFNVDPSTSEMAHMFYVTLGNVSMRTTDGNFKYPCEGCLPVNTGPFSNIQLTGGAVASSSAANYWSDTQYAPTPSYYWFFDFGNGYQYRRSSDAQYFAWAVRSGDIGDLSDLGDTGSIGLPPVVPLPPAVWLFGSALGLMGVMRRKIIG